MAMRIRAVLAAVLLWAVPACAGIPAGGMDLIADHWLEEYEPVHRTQHEFTAFGEGPLRLSLYGVTMGGIKNNVETASTPAGIFASERHLSGRFFAGGSFGQGSSSSLTWSHGEVHGGALVSDQMALRVGYNNDQFDYLNNGTDDANVVQNRMRGVCIGADVFGSPRAGWFVQFSGDLLPLKTSLNDGSSRASPSFTVRGVLLLGTSLFYNVDISLMAMAIPRLGDSGANAGSAGLGASLTF